MNPLLIASALAGLGAAIGHSYLSERYLLGPMFAARGDNRVLGAPAMRRVIRWVFHLPSFAWAQVALATLWFVFAAPDADLRTFSYFGAAIYVTAALANLWALRAPHVGNMVLTIAAATLLLGAA